MRFFGVRYWQFLFWVNVGLAVVHALHGNNMVFMAMGMALLCRAMIAILKREEN